MPPVTFPLDPSFVREFARDWIDSWNSRDIERILAHYDEEVTLISPVALRLLNNGTGIVHGKPALRAYFQRGLQAYPGARFDLNDTFSGVAAIVLTCVNQTRGRTAEVMQLSPTSLVQRVWANYDQ